MKTIFISSFHPLISRNILATPVLKHLLSAGDVRVIILTPERSCDYIKEEYGGENIIVEGIDMTVSKRDIWMRHMALSALATKSVAIKRRADMERRGEYFAFVLGTRLGHRFVRGTSRLITPRGTFSRLFEKYRPSVVFSTDVQSDFDVRLMHEAKRRSVRLLGMVRSWDNLTIKGLLRVIPEVLVVNNQLTRDDAVKYHEVSVGSIRVVGIPHYDAYMGNKTCERTGILSEIPSKTKRIILYVATGDRYINHNSVDCEVLEMLAASLNSDESIVVRLPIADTVNCLGAKKYAHVYFDQVDKNRFTRRKFVEISKEDDTHLQNLLRCCDIVVTGPSTMCVDAAIFDKPIILVGFNGKGQRTYYNSIARYYDYNHFEPILQSKGVWYVEGEKELKDAVKDYRNDSSLDASGRKKIVVEQTEGLSGKASVLLAQTIGELL